jgi:hypothetical protein
MLVALLDDQHDDIWTGTFREWFRGNKDWLSELSPRWRQEIWAGLRSGRAVSIRNGGGPEFYIKKLR